MIIHLKHYASIEVGALGRIQFAKGLYAYVGSAQTSLKSRMRRHLKQDKKKFWHIDYFLDNSVVVYALIMKGNKSRECEVAKKIGERGEAVKGFGCSDCKCESHLYKIVNPEFLDEFMQKISLNCFC